MGNYNSTLNDFINLSSTRLIALANAVNMSYKARSEGKTYTHRYRNELVENFSFNEDGANIWKELTDTSQFSKAYREWQLIKMYELTLKPTPAGWAEAGYGWVEILKLDLGLQKDLVGFVSDWNILLFKDLAILSGVMKLINKRKRHDMMITLGKTSDYGNYNTLNEPFKSLIEYKSFSIKSWAYSYLKTNYIPS